MNQEELKAFYSDLGITKMLEPNGTLVIENPYTKEKVETK